MEILREQVRGLKKIPVIVHKCLNHTLQNPQDLIFVGIMWINHNVFIFNLTIFSDFINKKSERIRRNFRQHGFDPTPLTIQEKRRIFENYNLILNDSRSWVGRTNINYNSRSSEEDAKNLSFHKTKSNKTMTPQTEYKYDFNDDSAPDFDADFFDNDSYDFFHP